MPEKASLYDRVRFRLGFGVTGNGTTEIKAAPSVRLRRLPHFFSPDGIRFHNLDGSGSDDERLTVNTVYVASAYIYVALRWRAWKYAEAPLIVVTETDQGDEWVPDHPLQFTFDNVSLDYDMAELLRVTRLYRDLWGAALWVKEPNAVGDIARLTRFSADEFETVPDPTGEFLYLGFRIHDDRTVVAREEAVFFREANP